jgi:hypothetical protein
MTAANRYCHPPPEATSAAPEGVASKLLATELKPQDLSAHWELWPALN